MLIGWPKWRGNPPQQSRLPPAYFYMDDPEKEQNITKTELNRRCGRSVKNRGNYLTSPIKGVNYNWLMPQREKMVLLR